MAANAIYEKRNRLNKDITGLLQEFTKDIGHVVTGLEFRRAGWPIGTRKENLIQYEVKVQYRTRADVNPEGLLGHRVTGDSPHHQARSPNLSAPLLSDLSSLTPQI